MFALVADVDSYQHFLPWCSRSIVHERDEHAMRASLDVAKGPFSKRLTTVNHLTPDDSIEIELVDGPFKSLGGRWVFESRADNGCVVSLHLSFEFASRIVGATFGKVFNEIAATMVSAFCRRAHEVYG
ncbi:MAG: type II toxin-antitoxin system RatA family toxin [Chromatiales bacterium]|nr:type II toxin-antitoxin system RatA family toxin [Chromatiales bacterium]